ncbi:MULTISPECIES: phosphodiesterase [unclassified Rhizobium]|uniref:phosphodiesterase n=1 Tax=unclassified Rhizobium TaxID=2613769 RepID=UPI000BCD96F9|nr:MULTISPECIES: phosphodiesterase [unclassified Rhizobium]MDH7805025.1 Icc protein [Rhizobium sp. AN67]MDQ4406631.1 phosphodiesterase [Rhizobium sp. AN63]SOD56047.1 3',5'-cyclic AMP phosphodiesterase CpdA [Rhizobium sp. AN6A]
MSERVNFLHLTDLHVGNPQVQDDDLYSDTSATLADTLAQIKALVPQPEFIVVSGDLTNRGDAGSYEELKRLLDEAAIDVPVLFALGNHDRRDGFYPVMLGRHENMDEPYDYALVIADIHVIVLDTSVPGKVGGAFEPGQIEWLAQEIENHPELPKLLVMHHAPALDFDRPEAEWESLSFADTEALDEVLFEYDVIGILAGHIHYDRMSHWQGIPVVVGIGQHFATDPLWLHEGVRMLSGASFTIGTVRDTGLSVTFVPRPSDRRELKRHTQDGMAALIDDYESGQAQDAAE